MKTILKASLFGAILATTSLTAGPLEDACKDFLEVVARQQGTRIPTFPQDERELQKDLLWQMQPLMPGCPESAPTTPVTPTTLEHAMRALFTYHIKGMLLLQQT